MSLESEALEAALPLGPKPSRPARWVPIRTLAAQHRDRVLAHLLKLDERDRLLRFGHVASDEQIGRYVASLDFERDEVFGVFDRRLALVAMAHLARGDAAASDGAPGLAGRAQQVAEFGVSVLPRQRGRGIGTRLFEHAVMHARNRGVRRLHVHVARDNSPMLAIVRRAGARVQLDGHEAVAELVLPDDTLGSQLGELLGHHAADLDYRMKLQVLRLDLLRG